MYSSLKAANANTLVYDWPKQFERIIGERILARLVRVQVPDRQVRTAREQLD